MGAMSFTSPFEQIIRRQSDPGILSAMSPNGHYLACASIDGAVIVLSLTSGNIFAELQFGSQCSIHGLSWLDHASLVVGNDAGEVIQARFTSPGSSPSQCAVISNIVPQSKRPVLSLCHDPIQNLLAVSFHNEIQIWRLQLSLTRQRIWVLHDSVPYKCHEGEWRALVMTFFGTEDRSLCAMADHRLGIWTYGDKSFIWIPVNTQAKIVSYAVSPDGWSLASSTADFYVYIWPLRCGVPDVTQQHTFKIPTGRNWINTAESLPLAYLDNGSLLTTDPTGTLYVLSPEGQIRHMFSVGENYFVCSIMVHEEMVYIVALRPTCTALLLGYPSDIVLDRKAVDVWLQRSPAQDEVIVKLVKRTASDDDYEGSSPSPASSVDCVRLFLKFALSRERGMLAVLLWMFATFTQCFNWRNLVASTLVLLFNNTPRFDLMTAYNVIALYTQFACYEFLAWIFFYLTYYGVYLVYCVLCVLRFVTRHFIVFACRIILRMLSN